MSNATQYLNEDVLMKMLRERIPKSACPMCQIDEWALHVPAHGTGVALPWASGDAFYMTGSPAAMLVCKNCGFIRLHSLGVLADALETVITVGPKPEDEAGDS
ncbi:hypothetical protein K7H92_15490 [Pseudomonas stutzeri]|nr:hypothetical protein [Stutzerimonas stutzeri]